MKKFLSLLLALTLVFALVACSNGKDTTSEPYTSTTQTETESTDNTETTEIDTSSENSFSSKSKIEETIKHSSTTENMSKPSTSTHTHSYSKKVTAANCTEKGYTTYTCSCGNSYKDNYTNPSHTYSKYKCTKCNTIDKTHTYEYLVDWLIKHGKTSGQFSKIEHTDESNTYSLVYDNKNNLVNFHISNTSGENSEYYRSTSLTIRQISNRYDYDHIFYDMEDELYGLRIKGQIESNSFTTNSPISYSSYSSDIFYPDVDISTLNSELDLARMDLVILLIAIEGILQGEFNSPNNSGLRLLDFGFASFFDSVVSSYG